LKQPETDEMQKILYLMRHGKAEDGYGKNDFDRELTDRGYREARLQALEVLMHDKPEHYMVSGSMRTRQTMEQIQQALEVPDNHITYDDSLYLASSRELFRSIEQLNEGWSAVCYIGHNPTTMYLSEYLTKAEIAAVKTSGIVKMHWQGRWAEVSEGCATLEYYKAPK
jgi:phosphohistidine phosphatase